VVHQRVRRQWAPVVVEDNAYCVRCGRLIVPGTPWDLGTWTETRPVERPGTQDVQRKGAQLGMRQAPAGASGRADGEAAAPRVGSRVTRRFGSTRG
jgi:hypothetical protein